MSITKETIKSFSAALRQFGMLGESEGNPLIDDQRKAFDAQPKVSQKR